jgi:hypothetical protein
MTRKNPHAVALGRRGGSVVTPKKIAAIRQNGLKGGRKPKFRIGDRVRGNEHAPNEYRDRVGVIVEVGPGKSEYGVAYADKPPDQPHGYLMSWWLDAAS